MSVLPILPQGFVVGRILTSRGDSADADKKADTAVVVGMVDFTPATPYRKLDAATVVTHSKMTAKLDSHGDLHPQRETSDNTGSDAEDGIWLPTGTWKVTYRLNTGMGALPEHNIEVTESHTEAAPLPLFANMGDAPEPGASYVTMQVPLNGQPGHYLVLNGEGSGLAWASGVLPETISDAVEDYLVANPPSSAPDATTTTKGLVELATTAEAVTGTDATRAVTPEGLKAVVDSLPAGGTDTEAVQDIVGAMVVVAGGTYDDAAGTITLPSSGGGSSLVQVGELTLPGTPSLGESVTVLADSSTVIPAGVTWDSGGEPTITSGRLLLSFVWSGDDWVGTYGLPFAAYVAPDTTAPTWTATFTMGTPTATTVPATASALAADNVAVTGYEVSYDGGTTPATITPSGSVFTLTGTADTTYSTTKLRAKDAAGNRSAWLSVPSYTMAAGGPSILAADSFTRADNASVLGTTEVGGLTWETTQTWGIKDGGARLYSGDSGSALVDLGITSGYKVSGRFAMFDSSLWSQLIVNSSAGEKLFIERQDNGGVALWRKIGTNESTKVFDVQGGLPSTSSVLSVAITATTAEAFVNGVLRGSGAITPTGSKVGFHAAAAAGTGAHFDDFEVVAL